MSGLNPRQNEAVKHTSSPLLVLAGAGSGKTRVITTKIAHLIQNCGVQSKHIAAMTFTNKAAREMKSRVTGLLSKEESRGLRVSTFHTLGLDIVRKESEKLGYRSNFSILDGEDSMSLIKEIMRRDFKSDGTMEQMVQSQISSWKSGLILPDQALNESIEDKHLMIAAKVYEEYVKLVKTYNAVDFDDLILVPALLLKNNPEVLEKWQYKIRYLLVDEYQDTNASQYQLVKLLVGNRGGLTVVGDDDQSIYAWRGAQPENMLLLKDDYPSLRVVKLEQNYRSTPKILRAANTLIANNPHVFEKKLWSDLEEGDDLRIIKAKTDEDEAERVVAEMLAHKFTNNTEFKDYSVLYRGNHQSRPFERALREQRIPYFLSGGTSFFAYSEVKDIMSYLKLLTNNDDDTAFLRIINTPRREIGRSTLEKVATYANKRGISLFSATFEIGLTQHLPDKAVAKLHEFSEWIVSVADKAENGDPVQAIKEMIKDIDYQSWLATSHKDEKKAERKFKNVIELVTWLERMQKGKGKEKTLSEMIAQMTLLDALDREGEDNVGDCVSLMTLHASKGLEFPHVFLVGMEEGFLPHRASIELDDIEEERRLAYVGITRAQKTLTFTMAEQRKKYGDITDTEYSRFLDEIPQENLVWESGSSEVNKNPEETKKKGRAHLDGLKNMLSMS